MKRFLVFGCVLLALTGCGVKPGDVDPPEQGEGGEFPRTYPDVLTDPPLHLTPARR